MLRQRLEALAKESARQKGLRAMLPDGFSELFTVEGVQAGLGFSAFDAGPMLQAIGVWWATRSVENVGDALTRWSLTLPMLLAGIGLGLLVVPLVDIALATVPETQAGAASGTYSTFQQVGAALGIAVIGSVFFGAIRRPPRQHFGTPTSRPAGGCSTVSSCALPRQSSFPIAKPSTGTPAHRPSW